MTRSLDAATITASQQSVIVPVWFVKLEFDTGNITLSTYDSSIAWGGDTYIGAGNIGAIGTVDESIELARSPIELTLSGLSSSIVAIALNEHCQGRRATIYFGYLDRTTRQLVATPSILYRGKMDNFSIPQQGKTFTISLKLESRFADWDRPRVRRLNNADQQARYPGDLGLEFVEQASEGKIWGTRAP